MSDITGDAAHQEDSEKFSNALDAIKMLRRRYGKESERKSHYEDRTLVRIDLKWPSGLEKSVEKLNGEWHIVPANVAPPDEAEDDGQLSDTVSEPAASPPLPIDVSAEGTPETPVPSDTVSETPLDLPIAVDARREPDTSHQQLTSHDKEVVRQAAKGHWLDILTAAGIQRERLDGTNHPCPKCGGTDRFSAFKDVNDRGSVNCRTCFETGGDGFATVQWLTGKTFYEAVNWVGEYLHATPATKPPATPSLTKPPANGFCTPTLAIESLERQYGLCTHKHVYCDRSGVCVGYVLRWDLSDGSKEFRPVSEIDGSWHVKAMPEPRPLYCLPELGPAQRVYVCEGETAVDAAKSIGLVATTSSGGSQVAKKTDWSPLAGKEVIILPDNDRPGRKVCDTVSETLQGLSPPANVTVVALPNLPPAGDIVDWIEAQGDAAAGELRRQIEELAPIHESAVREGPMLVSLADIEAREVDWLWPGRIAAGRITLLVGRPGAGKSFLTCDMAARVSKGREWPDGSRCPQGSVILIAAEDDPSDTIRPRLDAHEADVHRIKLLTTVRRARKDGAIDEISFTLADIDALEAALQQTPDCRLIVVDPIGSYLGGSCDAHRDNEVRAVLAPVARLAEQYGPAVLIVAHRKKGAGNNADDMALGSRGFTGIARSVLHLSADPEDEDRRLLLPGKNNLAAQQQGLAFSISMEPARVVWDGDPVDMSADEGLANENRANKSACDDAVEWLQAKLAGGVLPANEVKDAAKAQGIKERTLNRAKNKAGVVSSQRGLHGGWVWSL